MSVSQFSSWNSYRFLRISTYRASNIPVFTSLRYDIVYYIFIITLLQSIRSQCIIEDNREINTLLLRNNIDYDYDSVLPVYNDVELLHFQLTWISTYFIFNLLQIILLQCGVTWSTSVLEPSQNFHAYFY
ncbi:hypothetical protein V1477_009423 [Vespula maculifrons]|uniref:Uncharacterized protein n=1 Tax=Vespula maculifrons TaxID=7453 RepID=A0ABD2CAL9_VESMC